MNQTINITIPPEAIAGIVSQVKNEVMKEFKLLSNNLVLSIVADALNLDQEKCDQLLPDSPIVQLRDALECSVEKTVEVMGADHIEKEIETAIDDYIDGSSFCANDHIDMDSLVSDIGNSEEMGEFILERFRYGNVSDLIDERIKTLAPATVVAALQRGAR